MCHSGSVGFSPEPHLHLEAHPASVSSTVVIRFHSMATIVSSCDAQPVTDWLLDFQDPMGPSLPFGFFCQQKTAGEDTDGARSEMIQFTPTAGRWYNATGEVSPPD